MDAGAGGSRFLWALALGLALGGPPLQSLVASVGGQFDPDGEATPNFGGQFDPDGGATPDFGGQFDPNG